MLPSKLLGHELVRLFQRLRQSQCETLAKISVILPHRPVTLTKRNMIVY